MDKQPGTAGDVEHITGSAVERRQDWTGSGGSSPADAGGLTRAKLVEMATPFFGWAAGCGGFDDAVCGFVSALLATKAAQPDALPAIRRLIDGSQPKDIPGAIMVIDSAIAGRSWAYDMTAPVRAEARKAALEEAEAICTQSNIRYASQAAGEIRALKTDISTSPAPSAKQEPSASEATKAQAKADLMPRREAFIKYAKSRALATIERVDDWGARTFIDTVVQAMWEAWFSALESAAAPSASASPAAPTDPWKWFADKAVDVLQRHIVPDGLSDHDAIVELYAIFDGPEMRAMGTIPQMDCDARQAQAMREDRQVAMLAASPAAAVAAPAPAPVAGSQHVPAGWNLCRDHEGSIVVQKDGIGGVVLGPKYKRDEVAASIFEAFLVDILAAAAPAVPVPVAELKIMPSPLYFEALALVHKSGKASVSLVQRVLAIGYADAENLVQLMLMRGDITEAMTSGNLAALSLQQPQEGAAS